MGIFGEEEGHRNGNLCSPEWPYWGRGVSGIWGVEGLRPVLQMEPPESGLVQKGP